MSLINEYRATEEAIKELQARLKTCRKTIKLQTELELKANCASLDGATLKSLRIL